jgi:putative transcriptional regulator
MLLLKRRTISPMLTRKELNTMSKAGSKLIKSANQALAYARGQIDEGFIVHVPEEVDVKSIRNSLGLTQPEFSLRFGFNVRAVQDWEQKRRLPERATRILLTVIAREPEAVSRALRISAEKQENA